MLLDDSLPVIPNSTTTAAVIAAAASAAQDNYDIISCNNQDSKDFEEYDNYNESVEDDRGATGNMPGIPKKSHMCGNLKNGRGTLMLGLASLNGNSISVMAHGPNAITPRLLHMLPIVAMQGKH